MDTLMFLVNAAKVALGLGFVIFIHELGHFLLAKWNGVRVETFSIGFGPTLASYRRGAGLRIGSGSQPPGEGEPPEIGETEYVLAALPLGGYVKMLGEGVVEGGSAKISDPRAYQNKSVWARMGIISAGVIMNLILGVLCFAYVFGQGGEDNPASIGGVMAGFPAYEAGLRAGDEIVAIDGRRDVSYDQMRARVSISGAGQKLRLDVRRPGVADEIRIEVEPLRVADMEHPTIGVLQAGSLNLLPEAPFSPRPGLPVASESPLGSYPMTDEVRVVAVGPEGGPIEPVADYDQLLRKLEAFRDRPIVVEVEHSTAAPKGALREPANKVTATIPPHHFLDFGLRMTTGPVVSIQGGSLAQKAGLKPGDRIVAVDGEDIDPMRLPDAIRARAGRPVRLTVERPGAKGPSAPIEVTITPDDSPAWADPTVAGEPLEIPGLGLALRVEPKVRAVEDGSPAARAGIKVGDRVRSLTYVPLKEDKTAGKAVPVTFGDGSASWSAVFARLQIEPWASIDVFVNDSKQPIAIKPEVARDWFHPDRGLALLPPVRKLPPQGLVASIRSGAEETYENILGIYGMFRGLAQRRVGTKAMGGLPRIAQIAYTTASMGLAPFVKFLGILSVNLAVLNFLPIPPLDGGQMVYLVAEKVRGRPLPDAALNVGTIAGIAFVLSLILFINFQDIYLMAKEYLS